MNKRNQRGFLSLTIALATGLPLRLIAYQLYSCSISYTMLQPYLNEDPAMQICTCWGFNVIYCTSLIMDEIWTSFSKATLSPSILKAVKSIYILNPLSMSQSWPNIKFLLRFFTVKKSWEILFTNPSARAGYDTRSIFKRSLTGLNSEFSFS